MLIYFYTVLQVSQLTLTCVYQPVLLRHRFGILSETGANRVPEGDTHVGWMFLLSELFRGAQRAADEASHSSLAGIIPVFVSGVYLGLRRYDI